MWVAWWASKKPAHKQAAYVCVYVLYLAIGEVRIWRLHCRQHGILVSSTIAHMSLQHCLCDLLSVIFVHFSVVHFFVQIIHLWIFLIPINMRTSCIHSLPQEIQIRTKQKKWTDFNTKEANNLTNKQKPKKIKFQKKKIISVRQDWVCVFYGKEILWNLWAMILCEREKKRKWGWGGEGWLTDLGGACIFSCTEDSIECHLFSHIRNRDDRQETSIRHKPQKAHLQE